MIHFTFHTGARLSIALTSSAQVQLVVSDLDDCAVACLSTSEALAVAQALRDAVDEIDSQSARDSASEDALRGVG